MAIDRVDNFETRYESTRAKRSVAELEDSRWASPRYLYPTCSVLHSHCQSDLDGYVNPKACTAGGVAKLSHQHPHSGLEFQTISHCDAARREFAEKLFETRLSDVNLKAHDAMEMTLPQESEHFYTITTYDSLFSNSTSQDSFSKDATEVQASGLLQHTKHDLQNIPAEGPTVSRTSSAYASSTSMSRQGSRTMSSSSTPSEVLKFRQRLAHLGVGCQFRGISPQPSDIASLSISESSQQTEQSNEEKSTDHLAKRARSEEVLDVTQVEHGETYTCEDCGNRPTPANLEVEQQVLRLRAEVAALRAQLDDLPNWVKSTSNLIPISTFPLPPGVSRDCCQPSSRPESMEPMMLGKIDSKSGHKSSKDFGQETRPPQNPKAASFERAKRALQVYNYTWAMIQSRENTNKRSSIDIPWPKPDHVSFDHSRYHEIAIWRVETYRFFCRASGLTPTSSRSFYPAAELSFTLPKDDSRETQVEKLKALRAQMMTEKMRWGEVSFAQIFGVRAETTATVQMIRGVVVDLEKQVERQLERLRDDKRGGVAAF